MGLIDSACGPESNLPSNLLFYTLLKHQHACWHLHAGAEPGLGLRGHGPGSENKNPMDSNELVQEEVEIKILIGRCEL